MFKDAQFNSLQTTQDIFLQFFTWFVQMYEVLLFPKNKFSNVRSLLADKLHHWINYFNSFESELVATAIIAFLMHEIVYFGRCLPFIIADYIPSFAKYKLQPVSEFFF